VLAWPSHPTHHGQSGSSLSWMYYFALRIQGVATATCGVHAECLVAKLYLQRLEVLLCMTTHICSKNSVNGDRGQARRQATSPYRPARSVQGLEQSSVLPVLTAEEWIGLFPGTSYAFDGSRYRSRRSTDWHFREGADGKEEAKCSNGSGRGRTDCLVEGRARSLA
jgi:hypothetical protein